MADDDEAVGVATLAMSMPDALAAIRVYVNNAPHMPQSIGSATHNAFLAGKDAAIGVILAAFRAEQRAGLRHLSADDMLKLGNIVLAADEALAAKLGVDVRGLPIASQSKDQSDD